MLSKLNVGDTVSVSLWLNTKHFSKHGQEDILHCLHLSKIKKTEA
jgi:hypothetical protein